MSAFSVYSANKAIDHILKTASWTAPEYCYFALFTSSTGLEENDSSSWTEVSDGAYARVDASTSFASASSGSSTNSVAEMIFPTATAAWGDVTHGALMDAATGGNVLVWGPLTDGGRTINTGDGPRFLLSACTFSVA